jgi:hypothetical protein
MRFTSDPQVQLHRHGKEFRNGAARRGAGGGAALSVFIRGFPDL